MITAAVLSEEEHLRSREWPDSQLRVCATRPVEAAVNAKQYTTDASGVIRGTTEIRGTPVGFTGNLVGNEWRISSVFEKQ